MLYGVDVSLKIMIRRTCALSSSIAVPTSARVVVIGGGIIGTSVAYHLAKGGWKDVLLLEQASLTAGTTWHAAGLVETFGTMSETSMRFRQYSRDLYQNVLEAETGQATGFKQCGFIEIASTPDRVLEFRRVAEYNRLLGVDVQEIGPEDVARLFPLCDPTNIQRGFYVAADGRVNPVDATMALAKGAKLYGATIVEGVRVADVLTRRGGERSEGHPAVAGVALTDGRTIDCEYVVNCAGMWARQLAARQNVIVPNQAAEHYYLITEPIPEVSPDWPVIEDPESYTYIRPEAGGLMVGLFEAVAAAWNVGRIPDSFAFGDLEPDWDRMTPYLEKAMALVPRTLEVGAKKFFCGPESFTPDLGPVIGEVPEVDRYFVAAGLNSIGILTGAGVGRLVAHWIRTGAPDMDVTGITPARFQRWHANPRVRAERIAESLGLVYKQHYPTSFHTTARNVKLSPLHHELKARNAYMKEVSGFESPGWFSPEADAPAGIREHKWGREHWFPWWQAEHTACRESAALFDMSFMAKFLVKGSAAGAVLDWLSTSAVDRAVGTITYTQWLNDRGTLEADVTITKLTEGEFMVVATDTALRHVEAQLHRAVARYADGRATVVNVTGAVAQINVQGPNSRKILEKASDCDLNDDVLPFRGVLPLPIGFAEAHVSRITYVGELGYEIYVPQEHAVDVFRCVVAAAEDIAVPMKLAGLAALGSLRLEKGYRDYGHDIDNTDSLLEAGLGFTADWSKTSRFHDGPFRGANALLDAKGRGLPSLPRRLASVLVTDPKPMMFGGEVLYCNGRRLCDVRVASYGHTVGGAVGLAMIENWGVDKITQATIDEATWEVCIFNVKYPATVSLRPLYDPKNERIKM